MANENPIYKVTDTELTSIADAIRAKTNTTGSLTYNYEFVNALKNFSSMPYTLDNILNRNIVELEGSTDVEVIPSYCFLGYTQLKSVPATAFPNCTTISNGTFQSCSELKKIEFPNCTCVYNNAFYACKKLSSVYLPVCSRINDGVFQQCSALSYLDLPACTYGNFSYCGLISGSFPALSMLNTYAFYQCTSLASINLPACTWVGQLAFGYCPSLSSVSIPACSFISNSAFASCRSLSVASFPVCSYIGNSAFYSCYNLKSLYLMSTAVVSLSNSNAFNSSPIGGYTASTGGVYGSVYVPTSLAAAYKTATNWSAISARIVGV